MSLSRISFTGTAVFLCLLLATQPLLSVEGNDKPHDSAAVIKQISAEDAALLIKKNKKNPDFVILDVRTHGEYSDGHIENAINLDVKSESFTEEVVKLGTVKTYLIHCRSGKRSAMAGALMEELGFIDIYDIKGGFVAWEKQGRPVTK